MRLLWAKESAYQHQAVIARNSIIPHLLPAVTEEEIAVPGCHQPGRREELWVGRKKTVTPRNPPKSRKDGWHTNFKSQADLFFTAIQNYCERPSFLTFYFVYPPVILKNKNTVSTFLLMGFTIFKIAWNLAISHFSCWLEGLQKTVIVTMVIF